MTQASASDPTGHADAAHIARLQAWFETLVDQAPTARAAWLAAHVADPADRSALAGLLDADARHGLLDEPASARADRIGDAQRSEPDVLVGRCFGAFRATRVIGQGGMAAVYLGERVDGAVTQRAAIKVLRRGLYSAVEQGLFRREQKALAALSHPDIAYLIDGGITDAGLPYLVLEYVDGMPVTEHADTSALALRARLTLFVSICRAVAAAHRQLIVHRDLKPSNILVTAEGRVKLLDFGIAKLLDDDSELPTRTGFGALTPEYAAPEQLRGEPVTTSTDVYALGVLLHELLTGQRPAADAATLRRPSSLRFERAQDEPSAPTPAATRVTPAELRGDLDNILLMALAAEPERRYRSATEFGDDVERHLGGQPVIAHPPSRWYRTRKFMVRHRGGVALAAIALTAVLASATLTAWQAIVAQREAARANLVRDFVVGVFESAKASLPRDQRPTPELLVDQAATRLASMSDTDAATRIDLLSTLASVWLSLSKFDAADAAFAEAQALARGRRDAPLAQALGVRRAIGWRAAGRNLEARDALSAALPGLDRGDSPLLPPALAALAAAQFDLGEVEAGLAISERAVATASRQFGSDSLEHLAARFDRGSMLGSTERYRDAVAELEPALSTWRERGYPEDDRYLRGLSALTLCEEALGALADPEASFRELLRLHQRLYAPPHVAIASSMRSLAAMLMEKERYDEALALLDDALRMSRALLSPDHLDQIKTLDLRGLLFARQRRFREADAEYVAALEICASAALVNEVCNRARNNRGHNFYREQRFAEAEGEMRVALDARVATLGNDHVAVAVSKSTLANVLAQQRRYDEAIALQREALGVFERLGMADSGDYALIVFSLAQGLHLAGHNSEGLIEIDRALALWRRAMPDGHSYEVSMSVLKIRILIGLGRRDELRAIADHAIALNVDPARLSDGTKATLREVSGRPDLYP
jgi:eukaryotic-like serine/threonine-protein kinase